MSGDACLAVPPLLPPHGVCGGLSMTLGNGRFPTALSCRFLPIWISAYAGMTDSWFRRSCSGATLRVDASDFSAGIGSLVSVRGRYYSPS